MILRLLHFLKGFLVLRLNGPYIERFLNICVRDNIYLWNIRKTGTNSARACASVRGFRRMRDAARKTGTSVRIMQKRGLPLFLHRHRKRRAFLIGILLFACILGLLTSFIWSVEIEDTEKIDKNMLRNALKACGLDVGVLKYTLKASDIKNDMLRRIPELSWIWVEVHGTRAFVHVREKTMTPEIVPANVPCNIVAARDGVITECIAEKGAAAVQVGDAVQKGALLISGTVETKHGGTLVVHAVGSVTAQTWYAQSGTFPMEMHTETESGAKKDLFYLDVAGHTMPLFVTKIPFSHYRTETVSAPLKLWGDLYLPASLRHDTLYETDTHVFPLDAAAAEAYYGQQLYESLCENLHTVEIVSKEYTHILEADGQITVTCTVTCKEEIGQTREILEEPMYDRTIF